MVHVLMGRSRSSFASNQGLDRAGGLLVDGHHEAAADAHRVADVNAAAEERRDGSVHGGSVPGQNVTKITNLYYCKPDFTATSHFGANNTLINGMSLREFNLVSCYLFFRP